MDIEWISLDYLNQYYRSKDKRFTINRLRTRYELFDNIALKVIGYYITLELAKENALRTLNEIEIDDHDTKINI